MDEDPRFVDSAVPVLLAEVSLVIAGCYSGEVRSKLLQLNSLKFDEPEIVLKEACGV